MARFTDLMVHEPGNKLWHMGNAVPLDGGGYRERKPWAFHSRVQDGDVAGAGRAQSSKAEWEDVVMRFNREQMFPM